MCVQKVSEVRGWKLFKSTGSELLSNKWYFCTSGIYIWNQWENLEFFLCTCVFMANLMQSVSGLASRVNKS